MINIILFIVGVIATIVWIFIEIDKYNKGEYKYLYLNNSIGLREYLINLFQFLPIFLIKPLNLNLSYTFITLSTVGIIETILRIKIYNQIKKKRKIIEIIIADLLILCCFTIIALLKFHL